MRAIGIAGIAACLTFGWVSSAHALTIAEIYEDIVDIQRDNPAFNGNPGEDIFPTFNEDNDRSLIVNDDGTVDADQLPDCDGGECDHMVGIIEIQDIIAGLQTDTDDVFSSFGGNNITPDGDFKFTLGGANSQLIGAFHLQYADTVVSKFSDGAGGLQTWDSWVAPSSFGILDESFGAGTTFVMLEIAATGSPDHTIGGDFLGASDLAFDSELGVDIPDLALSDVSVFAVAGFTGAIGADEFHLTETTPIILDPRFRTSLSITGGSILDFKYAVVDNNLGTQIAGFGNLFLDTAFDPGADYDYRTASDGDYIILVAPMPAAAWIGFPMLGLLGIGTRIRQLRAA